MKKYCLTAMITFFLLLIGVTEIWAQKDYKAEELMKALHSKNCTAAISIAKLIQSPDYTDEDGLSVLMLAASSRCIEVVKMLLAQGANVNLQIKDLGATALIAASMVGDSETVKLLLEKGAQVDLKLTDGLTALMLASKYGYSEVVKLLLQYGANVELRTKDSGQTALMLASTNGKNEVVKILSDKKAKPDLLTNNIDLKILSDRNAKPDLLTNNIVLKSAINVTSQILLKEIFKDMNSNDAATTFSIPSERPLIVCLSLDDCFIPPQFELSGIGSTLASYNKLNIEYNAENINISGSVEYKASLKVKWLDDALNPVTTIKSDENGFPKMSGYQYLIVGGSLNTKSNFTVNNKFLSFINGSMAFIDFNSPAVFKAGTICNYDGIFFKYSNGEWTEDIK